MLRDMTNSWHELVSRNGMRVDMPDCAWSATKDCITPLKLRNFFQDTTEIALDFTAREKGFK
eukprot:1313053-Lingulodinium_polyedra.AAC.1